MNTTDFLAQVRAEHKPDYYLSDYEECGAHPHPEPWPCDTKRLARALEIALDALGADDPEGYGEYNYRSRRRAIAAINEALEAE